jgi:hypothetical protein
LKRKNSFVLRFCTSCKTQKQEMVRRMWHYEIGYANIITKINKMFMQKANSIIENEVRCD